LTKEEKWAKFVSEFAKEVALEETDNLSGRAWFLPDAAMEILHECGLYINESC
jgi:hypothetical protein